MPRRGARTSASSSRWPRRSAPTGPSTRRRGRLERVRRPRAALVRASATTASRRSGSSGRAPSATTPARRTCTRQPVAPEREGQVLPGRVPAADRAARLRVPVRPLHRADALPLQLGDDDHARGGGHPEAGGSLRRDHPPRTRRRSASPTATGCGSSRAAASSRRRRNRRPRLPGLVWMALHFAEAKVNWLTHDVGDPLIGTPEYKTSAVRVEPSGARSDPRRGSASGHETRRSRRSRRRDGPSWARSTSLPPSRRRRPGRTSS